MYTPTHIHVYKFVEGVFVFHLSPSGVTEITLRIHQIKF